MLHNAMHISVQTVIHVGPFLCQRGRCWLGSFLCLGIRLVCVFSARTVVAVIGAATGTFVAVVVGDGMVGACVGTFALDPGRAFASAFALALVSGVVDAQCYGIIISTAIEASMLSNMYQSMKGAGVLGPPSVEEHTRI